MAGQPSLSIEQLLGSLQRKGIPLAFEMGTFLVLETTERLIASVPVIVSAADVWLSDDGEVILSSAQPAPSEREACRALIVLLGDLLVRSAPGVPPPLLALVELGPSEDEWRLQRLRDDLEASLVPLNRGATRRVLARLLREIKREVERHTMPPPDAGALEEDLDSILGLEDVAVRPRVAEPAAPTAAAAAAPRPAAATATGQLELDVELEPEAEAEPEPAPAFTAPSEEATPTLRFAADAPPRPRANVPAASSSVSGATPALRGGAVTAPRLDVRSSPPRTVAGGRPSLDEFEEASDRSAHGGRIGLGLLLLAVALAGGYWFVGRQQARDLVGLTPEHAAEPVKAPPPAPARRYGELRVTSTPDRAQVLMRVGSGPAVVPKLPVGVAHEFVALQPGFAPARAIVPPDAQWQPEAGEPRYELALQLNPTSAPRGRQYYLGPTRLPQDMGHASGSLGSVRVVTSPPGAGVYQLIGFTPDVSVKDLPVDQPVELLVFLPGRALQHATLSAGDWKQGETGLVADVSIALAPAGR